GGGRVGSSSARGAHGRSAERRVGGSRAAQGRSVPGRAGGPAEARGVLPSDGPYLTKPQAVNSHLLPSAKAAWHMKAAGGTKAALHPTRLSIFLHWCCSSATLCAGGG